MRLTCGIIILSDLSFICSSDSGMVVEADWGDDCTLDAGMASIDEPLPTGLYAGEYDGSDNAKLDSDDDSNAAVDAPSSPAASDSKQARYVSRSRCTCLLLILCCDLGEHL